MAARLVRNQLTDGSTMDNDLIKDDHRPTSQSSAPS